MKNLKSPILTFLITITAITFSVMPVFGQSGKELFEKKCFRCHSTLKPTSYSLEDWPGLLNSMRDKAALTKKEYDEILEYIKIEAIPAHEKSFDLKPIVGGYLYTEYFQSPEKTKNFDIHYLAVYLSGWMSDKISYFGEFELEHGGAEGKNTFVEQAYLDYWFVPNVAVRIGAMLTPFNRFDEFHGPLENLTITRPQMSREIGVSAWKDVGVDLHGYFNLNQQASVMFNLYTINGLGSGSNLRGSRQYLDNNENKAYGTRVNFLFNDILEIGGSLYQGKWDNEGKYNLSLVGGHFMFHSRIFDLYGEYASATFENPAQVNDGDMSGYFVQISKRISGIYQFFNNL